MQVQTIFTVPPLQCAALPPTCPYCGEPMSLQAIESWTLLHGNQLDKYIFDCCGCGHTSTHVEQTRATKE